MKKRGLILALIIMLILSSLNIFLFLNKGNLSYSGILGHSIKNIQMIRSLPFMENFSKSNFDMDLSLIAFVGQWIILIIVLFVIYSKFSKAKKEEKIKINYEKIKNIKLKKSKPETDMDILYKLLKEKKSLRIGLIAETFKISKETAIEWGKILENSGLVTIEYPAFREPNLKIIEKEVNEEINEEKEILPKEKIEKTSKENKFKPEKQNKKK
ncbi:MAG: hypothetical protein QW727_00680 [Candidatus Pacearchaeota archaeon]